MPARRRSPERVNEIIALRKDGYSLEAIGKMIESPISREAVRLTLVETVGTTNLSPLIARTEVARMLKVDIGRLYRLENKGKLHPIRRGLRYYYRKTDINDVEKILRDEAKKPAPRVKRVCEMCGAKFQRPLYTIKPTSTARFCSRRCLSSFLGRTFGFGARKWSRKQRHTSSRMSASRHEDYQSQPIGKEHTNSPSEIIEAFRIDL